MNTVERGSQTAKNGFRNEDDIVRKFNDWKNDKDAQVWLIIMKYKLSAKCPPAFSLNRYLTSIHEKTTFFDTPS